MPTAKEIKTKYKATKRTNEKPVDIEGVPVNPLKIELEHVAISKLHAAEYNPRVMPNDEMSRLCKGISEFGFVNPAVVNTIGNVIVGGHQRIRAAQLLGMTEVPVTWVTLDKKKEKALNIALNRISGEWKEDELLELLKELNATTDFDMSLTGFDDEELRALLGDNNDDLGDEDAEVEPEENPFVKTGDLWQWGDHKLLVGDSTNLEDVDKLLSGKKADLCVTDPPYNVDIQGSESRVKPRSQYNRDAGQGNTIKNDNMTADAFEAFLSSAFKTMEHALKPGGCFYIYYADGAGNSFPKTVASTKGLVTKQCLIWVKNNHTLGRQDYNYMHEPCLYGWKEGAAHYFSGDYTLKTVIEKTAEMDIPKLSKVQLKNIIDEFRNAQMTTVIRHPMTPHNDIHPTQKPVGLLQLHIYASSRPNETVLDLFSGSGSTLITCRKTGRKGRAIEYDPKYAQASLRRMLQYDGTEPMLLNEDGTATPFSKVESDRKKKK